MKNEYVFLFTLLSLIVVTNLSCNRQVVSISSDREVLVFPPKPDSAKIQFLTVFSNSEDILKPRSKFSEFVLGKRGVLQIGKPYGVFLKSGKLYITDTGIPGLNVIDFQNRKFYQFKPDGRGKLTTPINCFVDDRDYLFIADSKRNQIVIFDEKRNFVNAIGDTGLFRPTDIIVHKDKIYVSNIKNHRIHVFNNDSLYTQINTFPESEPGNEDFLYSPSNICIKNDKIYVSDFGAFCVKIFDIDGKYISTVGGQGLNYGRFNRNKGIAVDNDENLFVVDASFNNVQIFDKEGRVLLAFGGAYTGTSGYLYLPAKIAIDYDNLQYFQQYVDPSFDLKYLIFITNQYGLDKVTVYGRVELKKQGSVGE